MIFMQFKYAFQNYDKTRHVRAALREKAISHKHAREIAVAIKDMSIESARSYLQSVINLERAIPFRRYNNEVGHKPDTGVMAGRYPRKAAAEFVKLLDNLESNAKNCGMGLHRLKINNGKVNKGTKN